LRAQHEVGATAIFLHGAIGAEHDEAAVAARGSRGRFAMNRVSHRPRCFTYGNVEYLLGNRNLASAGLTRNETHRTKAYNPTVGTGETDA
jgi:hypothetical protein